MAENDGSTDSPTNEGQPDLLGGGDLETVVLHLVKDDPFATINEIKHRLRSSTDHDRVSWWQLFAILRRRGLLSRRSRFRFARGRH